MTLTELIAVLETARSETTIRGLVIMPHAMTGCVIRELEQLARYTIDRGQCGDICGPACPFCEIERLKAEIEELKS